MRRDVQKDDTSAFCVVFFATRAKDARAARPVYMKCDKKQNERASQRRTEYLDPVTRRPRAPIGQRWTMTANKREKKPKDARIVLSAAPPAVFIFINRPLRARQYTRAAVVLIR